MNNQFSPSDLKTILHSKRANIYYLQYCRVLVNGGRVEYVTDEGKQSLYWNIPIANTSVVMLGTGTSITQAAMREFAKAGVLIGFCGGGGTPLYAGNEVETAVSWLSSQSEYRPTEYLQHWVSFWFDDQQRLAAALAFQRIRIQQIQHHWLSARMQRENGFMPDESRLQQLLAQYEKSLANCRNSTDLLAQEAVMTKALYKLAATTVSYGDFTRAKRGGGVDVANRFLDHGNYLAYGLAAVATRVIGLPHGLAVLHGKTRRGGLVFDVADLVIWIGSGISALVYTIHSYLGWLSVAIMGGLWPLLVMTGMHRVFTPTIIQTIAETGKEGMVMPSEIGANLSLGGSSLAVAWRTKNPELRQTALAAAASAIVAGISEPALYGVAIRLKRPLIAALISGFVCGGVAGVAGLASHSMASPGLFTSVQFFDPANPMTIVWVFGVMILAVVLSFILTLLLGFEDIPVAEEAESEKAESAPVLTV